MDGRRTALIVASDEFEHAGLGRLQAPAADAEALAAVLGDPDIGGFHVQVVHNSPSHTVQAHVEDLFAEGRPDDLLLLHFSGHGLKSDSGELFFAATNTRPDRLASTAVSADFVQRCMRGSRARSIVLFLDCCYGGAFGEGVAVRAAGPANVLDSFPAGKLGGGRGRAVITASSAMEYAFEGSALATADQRQPSVFTTALVEGLSTGAADRDEDGLVSLNELYDYVFDQVRAQNPNQTPSRDIELQGELYVARSRRKRVRPIPLPADLQAAVQDGNMYTRLGAVGELRARLASPDPGVALGAREALEAVARSDTSYVAEAALDALAAAPAVAEPAPPDLTGADTSTAASTPPRPETSPVAVEPEATASAPAFLAVPTAARAPAPASEATRAPEASPTPEPTSTRKATQPREATPRHTDTTESAAGPVSTARVPGHRSTAGRTTLTGGALVLGSALLPEFVWGGSVFGFKGWLGVVLLVLSVYGIGSGLSALTPNPLRDRWPFLVIGTGVLAAAGVVLLLAATSDLGSSDVQLGIWVALAGCLTTVAGGVVAVAGLQQREDPTAPRPAGPTALTRLVGHGALTSAGTMLAATFAVRFMHDQQALVEPYLVWAWIVPGLVGLAAGILTLRLRRWPLVGPALVAGAATNALWGLWDMPRIWDREGTSALNTGFFLEFVGLLGLVAAGVAALVCLRRQHDLSMARPAGGAVALTVPVAVLAAVPFLRLAQLNWEGSKGGDAIHDVLMAVMVVAVAVLATMLRPGDVARFALLGWTLGAVGVVVAYWRLLTYFGAPLVGVPYVLLALAAMAVVAAVNRPWRTPGAAPGDGTRADSQPADSQPADS